MLSLEASKYSASRGSAISRDPPQCFAKRAETAHNRCDASHAPACRRNQVSTVKRSQKSAEMVFSFQDTDAPSVRFCPAGSVGSRLETTRAAALENGIEH